MALSPTRYAAGPRGRVAYRINGDGDVAVVLLTWWGRSVDGLDDHAGAVRYFRYIEPAGACLVIDPRGIGVSDPLGADERIGRDAWAADAATVLDHLGCDALPFIGEDLAGHAALALAAAEPARVTRVLVANGALAVGLSDDEIEHAGRRFEADWGTGSLALAIGDHGTDVEAGARAERLAASPAVARAWLEAALRANASDLVGHVRQPVLVTSIGDSGFHREQHARELAAALPNGSFRRLDGARLYVGDPDGDDVMTWLTGAVPSSGDRALVTVLLADVVASTAKTATAGDQHWHQVIDQLDVLVAAHVGRRNGRIVKQTGDGHLAEFGVPSDAIRCGLRIAASVAELGIEVRVGIHTGEVERRGDDIAGLAVDIAARLEHEAGPGEVVVTRSTADLVAGSGIRFEPIGDRELRGVPGRWPLVRAVGPV